MMCDAILKTLFKFEIVRKLGENIEACKFERKKKNSQIWLVWQIQRMWKNKARRRGHNRNQIYQK